MNIDIKVKEASGAISQRSLKVFRRILRDFAQFLSGKSMKGVFFLIEV